MKYKDLTSNEQEAILYLFDTNFSKDVAPYDKGTVTVDEDEDGYKFDIINDYIDYTDFEDYIVLKSDGVYIPEWIDFKEEETEISEDYKMVFTKEEFENAVKKIENDNK